MATLEKAIEIAARKHAGQRKECLAGTFARRYI
jgi:hypothetical protein